ncbi:MAG: penicillin-binding transpeptidase domain-containing protein [Clostridiales bacterium]|nr:penicillin-binding transpeptidase domain-containing protein [Clostridiales bacterium]
MKEPSVVKRLLVLGILVLVMAGVMGGNLVELQIVNGKEYAEKSERKILRSYPIKASRGEIVDRYGRPLVTNRMVFSVQFDYVYWDQDHQNEVLLKLAKLLTVNRDTYFDTLPVTRNSPYSYTFESGDSQEKRKLSEFLSSDKKAPKNPDAAGLMSYLKNKYKIDSALSESDQRIIAGIRYEMEQRDFSTYNLFTFATDIDISLVSQIMERHFEFPGVNIDEQEIREYRTQSAANILGRVGQIYKEEYVELKQKGYPMDAIIGKDGMEKALEGYLRGIDGIRSVETNVAGKVTNEISTKDPQPGENCVLTIDIALQEVAEQSLAANIARIKANGQKSSELGAADIKGGAAVVIDVKTGEVLALANYPTYNLETFNQEYSNLLKNPLKPMFNRAISGIYPPGSTFKMVTALAGLEEGVIKPDTVIVDRGMYTYYSPNYTPACWIWNEKHQTHGPQNVSDAIENSCNYFFFDVGRILTIDRLNKYAKMLGLGMTTGIELSGEAKGNLAGPESRAQKGGDPWQLGETIQAAIGQSEEQFTPIQLANYLATIVNGGTRYKPHLLKSVKNSDYSTTIKDEKSEVLDKISMSQKNYEAIMKGMRSVAENGTAASVFRNYPIAVGGKTGSAQVYKGSANGIFVGFAPYDDPQIAVCIVGENAGSGNRMANVAKDIFDYYFKTSGETSKISQENVLLH